MTVIPDFGYKDNGICYNDLGGWKLFYDFVKKEPKFQKLSNYIEQRNLKKREKNNSIQKKKKMTINQDDLMQVSKNDELLQKSKMSKELESLIGLHQN